MSDHKEPIITSDNTSSAAKKPLKFRLEEVISAIAMAVLCLLTIANVLVRYFTDISFAFTEEISVFFIVILTFTGTATAFARKKHLAILFVVKKLTIPVQRRFEAFGIIAAIITFGVLFWYGGLMWLDDIETGVTSPGLGIPQAFYTAAIPVLSALVIFRLVVLLFQHKKHAVPFENAEDEA